MSIWYYHLQNYRSQSDLDVIIIAETKLDKTFPKNQFLIEGFGEPFRLDVTSNRGGLLVYVRHGIIAKELPVPNFPNDIQVIPIELSIRKQKLLLLPIYRHPSQDQKYFVDAISVNIDKYSAKLENLILIGDFNMEPNDSNMVTLAHDHNLYNLVKGNICFKSQHGRCIDLILTNKKHSFMKSQSFETGFSDHHRLIYKILKSTFTKVGPKKVVYREYKNFNEENFLTDLNVNLKWCHPTEYQAFEDTFVQTLDKHAPKKQKVLRANNKPYVNKDLSKAIKTRSRLKNIANKTKKETDINKFKSQRNLVLKVNRKLKRDFYKSVDPKKINTDKNFWKMVKPMVSNVNPMEQKIILIEGEEILAKDEEVAECLNTYFVNITDSLNLNASDNESNVEDSLDSRIDTSIVRVANHQSILAIKEVAKNVTKFDFEHVNPWNVMEKIESLYCNKSVSGNIPTNVLKQAKEVACPYVTDCINNSINDGIFLTELKMADVTSLFKSGETTTKKNFRPITILPCVSKVYERLLGDQLNEHLTSRNDILCNLLSGFRKGYSTQHALQIVIEN